MANRVRGLLAAACAAAAIAAPAGVADTPQGDSRIGGVVPVQGAGNGRTQVSPALGSGNLIWHGGRVMRRNTTYAVFWAPSGHPISSSYKALVRTFLQDVAADSGLPSNVYSSGTQYAGSNGRVLYESRFGGAVTLTDPFPADGCVDPATRICLSDAQLRAAIDKAIAAKGWTRDPSHAFFVFTPKNVGSCFALGPTGCAYTDYCGYHGAEGAGTTMLIYANLPYGGRAGCVSGQRPNGNDADDTINVLSHEHSEMITDPDVATGWFDSQGLENGDKCSWLFGPSSGPPGARFNQTIDAHRYFLQLEWSNAGSRCVQGGV